MPAAGGLIKLFEEDGQPLMDMVFQQAPAFMAVLRGPTHVFTMANDSYLRLVGGRPVIGRTVAEALPEVRDQGFIELLDQVFTTGVAYEARDARVRLIPGDGRPPQDRMLDFVYQPMRNRSGEVTGIFAQGVDVTERALAQQAVRDSNERLALATDAAEIGLWDVDPVRDTLYWPPRLREMFGLFSPREVTLQDFVAGLHPDDREATVAAFRRALDPAERALYDVEYRTVGLEDGVTRWVAAKGRGLFDDAARCVRVIGTAIDITTRKRDQAELRRLNATLEERVRLAHAERQLMADVIDKSDASVWIVDSELRLLAVNAAARRAWREIYGVEPEPGPLAEALALLPDRPWARRVEALWRRATQGETLTELRKVVDRRGEHRAFEMHFHPLKSDGRTVAAYFMVHDVTARERDQERLRIAEAALNQAYKLEAVGRLTGGIAHDFNNVLHVVSTSIDLIDRLADDPQRVRQLAASVRRSVLNGAKLTGQLLAFSRQQSIEFTTLCVRQLVQDVDEVLRRTVAPAELVVELPVEALWVSANATQLEMALLNLAVNARDAMQGRDGRVTLFARVEQGVPGLAPGAYVCLGLRDTGAGMPPDVLKKAFEPFFTTKPVGKGTGLGLNQVFGMAQQGGGTATIDSVEGEGTTVCVYLRQTGPAAAPAPVVAQQQQQQQQQQQPQRRHVRLLCVDDEADVRAAMVEALSGWGYDVRAARDGEAALALVEGWPPEMLLLDYALPGMNGAELAARLRAVHPQIPVLFATGYADMQSINALPGPAACVLRKPFELAALREALAALAPQA